MDLNLRNNIKTYGDGDTVLMFAHGFGCDQHMWRYVAPAFEDRYKIILFDHVGSGGSDISAYDKEKYNTLEGYGHDVLEIIEALGLKNVIFVGHSVSAIIGIIAAIEKPDFFKSLILVAPSPSYINDNDYTGGFTREELLDLLESLDKNHLGWSMAMAPIIMANADRSELSAELANSFCRTDPEITKHFARITFLTDKRHILSECETPVLILQCTEDVIAPLTVGQFMKREMKNSELVILKATGHCPNLSAPEETITAMKRYLSIEHA